MKLRQILVPPVALAAVGLVVPAGPVGAALVTRCVGAAAGAAIPGDLVVPAGRSCSLSAVAVTGSVTVRAGADLTLLDGSTVAGGLTVAADGFVELIGSSTPSLRSISSIGSTSKSAFAPSERSSATLPSRWLPKWKSSPTTMRFIRSTSTSTRCTNAFGGSALCSASKWMTRWH